jgi:signal transduction histidine kinase
VLRRLPPPAIDAAIVLVVYVATAYPSVRHAQPWNIAFATLASVPLLWRRRWPIPVALATGIGTTALSITQMLPDLPYGQLVATYTFAELSGALWRLAAVLGTIAGVAISLSLPGERIEAYGYVGIGFVTAYALGTGVRARRDRIAMLEERTRRLAEEQSAAAARERARIARDMHDVLAHSVGLMVVQAEGGAAIVHTDPHRAEAAFEAVAATGREALVQLRHTLGVLRENHETPGLDSLLRNARATGLDVSLVEHGTPGEADGETAYRVVQEALTNVVKHSGARKVEVTLAWSADVLRITVVDDGRGASPAGKNGGHGLAGMRERVGACGGELHTGPGPGDVGFSVAATLPRTV